MGLERLACVVQNVNSLFDVDTVMHITNKVSEITGAHYGESHDHDVSLRIITDHIRAASFLICDGVLPSNEGRGYVLRRLLRRAARHGKLLGVNRPFLYEIVETVVQVNEGEYKDMREKAAYITKVVRTEEESFAKTIDGGMKIFSEMLAEHKAKGETTFSGADAFKLYDTFGFPIDLTIEMARDEGLSVDEEGFQKLMREQKERAREARKALGDLGWAGIEFGKEIPSTEFDGYDANHLKDYPSHIVALAAEGELRDEIVAGVEGMIVLDKSPFYAEMGGQVADHGVIRTASGAEFTVTDVQKNKGGKFMHTGVVKSGSFRVGDEVLSTVDMTRRKAVMRAHSATHLLDAALKKVLGDHVHQAGSLVEPDRLRFDFTHFESITPDQLAEISSLVNEAILEGYPVITEVLPIEEAKKKGAVAAFGEKYGEVVRVVEMGDFSMEFCGGTHLDNTAKAGAFRIKSEGSVASGVRRIEATVGRLTLETINANQQMLLRAAQILKTTPGELDSRIEQQLTEMKDLRQHLEQMKAEASLGEARSPQLPHRPQGRHGRARWATSPGQGACGGLQRREDHSRLSAAPMPSSEASRPASLSRGLRYLRPRRRQARTGLGGFKVLTAHKDGMDAAALRQMGDFLRDKEPSVVAVLASVNGEKITFQAVCGPDAVKRGIKAGELVKQVCGICGGKGGGKPDSAMGGGNDLLKIDDALASVDDFVAGKL